MRRFAAPTRRAAPPGSSAIDVADLQSKRKQGRPFEPSCSGGGRKDVVLCAGSLIPGGERGGRGGIRGRGAVHDVQIDGAC